MTCLFIYSKEVAVYETNKTNKQKKNSRPWLPWISRTQLILALAFLFIFFKLLLFISLLCSAASITLCYQNTSMEVVLVMHKL